MGEWGDWIRNLMKKSPARVLGGLGGFLCGLLIILIGFWETLLIILLTFVGLFAGYLIESGGDVGAAFDRFRGHDDGGSR